MTHKQRWVLVLTAVASLMVALDVTVVSTALATMRTHLHASINQLEWTVNAYGLSLAVLLMTGAVLGDRFGRRRMFVFGLALFSAASAACALSSDVGWLIAARTLQGAGAAVVAPLSLSLLSNAFPPERRGWALGIYGAITGLAVVAGPVVGGAVTQGLAWQWIFWLNVPIGLAAIPFALARIEESFGPRTAPDLGGLALVSAATLGVVWGLVRGNTAGWGSGEVLATLIGGGLFSVLFVAWEMRAPQPMLPMGLFRERRFAVGNAVSMLMFASLFSAVFFMAQFQQTVLGQTPLQTGLRLIPWTGTVMVVAPLAGALVDRIGERPLIVGGLAMQAAGFAWVASIAKAGLPYSHLIAPLILAGIGISTAIPAAQNATVSGVPPSEIGKASGTFSTMRQLGGAFGLAIAVAVFTGAGSYLSPDAFAAGFGPAMAVSVALSLGGSMCGVALRVRGAPRAVPEPA